MSDTTLYTKSETTAFWRESASLAAPKPNSVKYSNKITIKHLITPVKQKLSLLGEFINSNLQ